jgi:hypothetical protein
MTQPQKFEFFRRWKKVCIAQGWMTLSVKERDEKRHVCHLTALHREKSSKDFNNGDIDRVFALFAVLIDPDDLDAQLVWAAYERGEDPGLCKRLIHSIRKSGFEMSYIEKIAGDKFGTRRLADLSLDQLNQLRITVIERQRSKQRDAASKPAPASKAAPKPQAEHTYVLKPYVLKPRREPALASAAPLNDNEPY